MVIHIILWYYYNRSIPRMMKVRAEARCPETYYEEIMRANFNKMTKANLVAFININSDEDNQVTMRPRKSTLVRIAEKIRAKHDANPPACSVKPKENIMDKFMGGVLLVLTKIFIAIIALEFLNAATLDLPPGEFFGVLAVAFLLIGIPLRVFLWERKYNG